VIEIIVELISKLALLGVEAAQSSKDQHDVIQVKFQAALVEAASKAGFDFAASDQAFEDHLEGRSGAV
jgi:predicted fused transcriptional regulator/phosphomethylpyrimidine kinase